MTYTQNQPKQLADQMAPGAATSTVGVMGNNERTNTEMKHTTLSATAQGSL